MKYQKGQRLKWKLTDLIFVIDNIVLVCDKLGYELIPEDKALPTFHRFEAELDREFEVV